VIISSPIIFLNIGSYSMKKFAVMFVMAMLLPLTACAQEPASKWKEGTHYKVLDKEATDKPVITEYFSF
tara:strand:+ start:227 stop:433 length:207 start_codon:yes stop_codon:yes gene_type:complete